MTTRFELCLLATLALVQHAVAQNTVRREMELRAQKRTYLLHVPAALSNDQLVPFHGGGIVRGRRGRIIDTDEAVRLWADRDGCLREPQSGTLPDTDTRDKCTVNRQGVSRLRRHPGHLGFLQKPPQALIERCYQTHSSISSRSPKIPIWLQRWAPPKHSGTNCWPTWPANSGLMTRSGNPTRPKPGSRFV